MKHHGTHRFMWVPSLTPQCSFSHLVFSVQEIRGRLLSAQSSVQQLRRQQGEAESGKRDAELRVQALQGERDDAHREREVAQRERERIRQERATLIR